MTTIEIKSILGKVLYTYTKENATIKDALEQAVKEKVNLSNSNLSNSNLSNSNLSNSNLRNSNLRNSNLSNSNLSNSNLSNSYLSNSNLSNSNLSNSNLRNSNLRNSDLRNSDLSNSYLSNSNLRNSYLSNSDLRGAKNKETAYLPIFCKWNHSIIGDKIQIGCKEKTIEEWDIFFASDEVYETKRNTDDFKQIQATYEAYKAYLTFLNK